MKKYLLLLLVLSFLSLEAQKAPRNSRAFRPGASGTVKGTDASGNVADVVPEVQMYIAGSTYADSALVNVRGIVYQNVLGAANSSDISGAGWKRLIESPENNGEFAKDTDFPYTPTYPIGVSLRQFTTPYSNVERASELLALIPESPTAIYVSPYGDNSDGTTWAKAFNAFSSAFNADPDVIYVRGGYYDISGGWSGSSVRPAAGTKNLAVIAVNGRVTVGKTTFSTTDEATEFPNMTARRGYVTETWHVHDMRSKDEYGAYAPLKKVDSRTKCGNTPNSYYDGFGTVDSVFVNLGGDAPVHGENYLVQQIRTAIYLDPSGGGRRIYLEGIDFYGSPVAEESGGEIVAVNCGFFYADASGFRGTNSTNSTLAFCKIAYSTGDGFGVFGGEHNHISVISEYSGYGESDGTFNRQNSSLHDGASLISINSVYRYAYGQNIADTGSSGASYSIYLNATIGDTFEKDNFNVTLQPAVAASQATIWLQSCTVGGRNSFDFRTETDGFIYVLDTPWSNVSTGNGNASFNYWKK